MACKALHHLFKPLSPPFTRSRSLQSPPPGRVFAPAAPSGTPFLRIFPGRLLLIQISAQKSSPSSRPPGLPASLSRRSGPRLDFPSRHPAFWSDVVPFLEAWLTVSDGCGSPPGGEASCLAGRLLTLRGLSHRWAHEPEPRGFAERQEPQPRGLYGVRIYVPGQGAEPPRRRSTSGTGLPAGQGALSPGLSGAPRRQWRQWRRAEQAPSRGAAP